MQSTSMNGQGHATRSRADMTLDELHAAYDALLADKMQVVAQKDKLFEQTKELIPALEQVTSALEGTEEYATSHGAHFVAVEARKLLDRLSAR